ncbi:trypsin-like peptidase domain-containing protein [Streptomyces sp. 6N223]|uniref:trypsin-like peptidase domain-containing protein n=1 Tax=Streptomyces sp. 6N223 TaxID=3457412 RepID=UPI003FD15EFD
MGDGADNIPNALEQPQSWLLRIRSADGRVLGAGVLLDTDMVLTCAHVLGSPERRVQVDLVGVDGAEGIPATVAEGGWVEDTDNRLSGAVGDLALLLPERPLPAGCVTPLHRQPPIPGRPVLMHGFPEEVDAGLPLQGRVLGRSGGEGRVAIAPVTPGEVVWEGFSGAGVIDLHTGHVIGIVVGRLHGRDPVRYSLMIPTGTVLRHLGHLDRVRTSVRGRGTVSRGMVSEAVPRAEDASFAAELAEWLRGDDHVPAIQAVLVGPADEARAGTLSRAVTLAHRELSAEKRDRLVAGSPARTVPPVGSLDVAIDVTRDTAEQATERILGAAGPHRDRPFAERLRRAGPLRLTIVLNGVDRARDPQGIAALLNLLAEQDSRLLLVFHAAGEAARADAVATARFRARLGGLARQLERTIGRGYDLSDLRVLVTPGRDPDGAERIKRASSELSLVYGVRARLDALRRAGAARRDDVLAELSETNAAARVRIDRAVDLLTERRARRDVLRGRLEAQRARARELTEPERDPELSDLYIAAHDLLWRAPCDVEEAEEAVRAYQEALNHRAGGGRGPGR